MSEKLFSTYWYRVANLKPAIRDSVEISRHNYRGRVWYVLRNRLNSGNHRFNDTSYQLISHMDGTRTLQEIWDFFNSSFSGQTLTQDAVIRLVSRLHHAELIQSDILPSTINLIDQSGSTSDALKRRMSNPFSLRFKLLDPDSFLQKFTGATSWLFTRTCLFIWLSLICTALLLVAQNWDKLTNSFTEQIFSAQNIIILWLTYPLIKILHELGHGLAVKRWGGEVHETGIMLLALTPIPYVDATASAAFPQKRHRIAVAAMGMMTELLVAAIAVFVWVNAETGVISTIAYNVMLIGGVSTLLFNGNPLLRYDGYFILSDLIEIPNLAQRSKSYLGYLLQHYLFRINTVESPANAPGEVKWFIIYGPLSFCYRILIVIALAWMFSNRFFVFGLFIALWGLSTQLIFPAFRTLSNFLSQPFIRSRKRQVVAIVSLPFMAAATFLLFVPMPFWTSAQAIIWLPEQASVRAGTDFEIVEILKNTESEVDEGTTLIKGQDPFLDTEIDLYRAHLAEKQAEYRALPLNERVQGKIIQDEIELIESELQEALRRQEALLLRSPLQGRFILTDDRNLTGRFIKQGQLIGYIVNKDRPTIRAVVGQDDIDLVRHNLSEVQIRLAGDLSSTVPASIKRIIPAADYNLPSPALGTNGGGDIAIDPTDPNGLRALESHFQIELTLPQDTPPPGIGSRVYVRFIHGKMPLATQWYRSISQLFMRNINV